ncbi:MAG: hypothetical protein J7K40_02640 [candidate division Zixibacteria bacterium]|nr:hypothetical protein [candidate division Zixibacteria bacterium]
MTTRIKKSITTATKLLLPFLLIAMAASLYAEDPGLPDSVIVGNLNDSLIEASPGDTIDIPVWIKNDENIIAIYLPIALDSQYISEDISGNFYDIFDSLNTPHWDAADFLIHFPDEPIEGLTTYSLIVLSENGSPWYWYVFNSGYEWVHMADFRFILSSENLSAGDKIPIIHGNSPRIGGIHFCFEDVSFSIHPEFITGAIAIVPDGYAYLPGDANMALGLWPPRVQGSDMTYLVNYFKGSSTSQPCLLDGFWASADINGDCNVIGTDVTRLVNYFRGTGIIEYCADYEPLWLSTSEAEVCGEPDGWPNCETPPVTGRVIPSGTGM